MAEGIRPPAVDRIRLAVTVVVLSLMVLTALITATLYEGPNDAGYRNLTKRFVDGIEREHPPAAEPPAAGADPPLSYWEDLDSEETLKRRRYLGRNFQRVKYAVYFGAGLCAATLAEISARYSWPLSIVPPERSDVATAISDFGSQLSMETGIYFTLFLGALYFPAITILRARGRNLFRARRPKATLEDQDKWLQSEGLVFQIGTNYTDVLAVLAPAGLASIGPLSKLLGY